MLNLNNLFVSETCSKSCAIDSLTKFFSFSHCGQKTPIIDCETWTKWLQIGTVRESLRLPIIRASYCEQKSLKGRSRKQQMQKKTNNGWAGTIGQAIYFFPTKCWKRDVIPPSGWRRHFPVLKWPIVWKCINGSTLRDFCCKAFLPQNSRFYFDCGCLKSQLLDNIDFWVILIRTIVRWQIQCNQMSE